MNQTKEVATSFQTLINMIKSRGLYDNVDELTAYYDSELSHMQTHLRPVFSKDFKSCSLRVIYDLHPKFRVIDIRKFLEFSAGQQQQQQQVVAHLDTVILVSWEHPSTLAMKGLEVFAKENRTSIQVFRIEELQFDCAQHALQPKFEPIRDDVEISRIMKMHNVKSKLQLPLIYSADAMARYLALKPGEIVKITRLSPSAGEYIEYRCCIKAST
jgi:DNA-directed RNA polymerase subunit H (RpoH/RPB5)